MTKEPDDEAGEASPSTPAKRKTSNIDTPKTTPNGPRTPGARKASAAKNNTPARKVTQGQKTPASAPARPKPGIKKGEPTLLGDFLLGRPSPNRVKAARRKSLDAVKAEMRAEVVNRVQQPGKVQQRVKQWQKANAETGVENDPVDEIVVEYETESDYDEPELARKKQRNDTPKRPGRRRSRSADGNSERETEKEKSRSKSVAPPKRVISDSHWMNKEAKKKDVAAKGAKIPKNFLHATATNPPVERKIEDWVKRMSVDPDEIPERIEKPKRKPRSFEHEEIVVEEAPTRRSSRHSLLLGLDDEPRGRRSRSSSERIKPSKDRPIDGGIRVKPTLDPQNDGSQVKPSHSPQDDGIRIKPGREDSVHSEIQVKPIRSNRHPKKAAESPTPTPRKRSTKHLKPPVDLDERSRAASQPRSSRAEEDNDSYVTPTPPQGSKRRKPRKSAESLDEVPFGNSAFSVLELPVGAEAGTMKKSEQPKRNPSFAGVPKVFKKVYNEGKKMMHDPEPPRGGANKPPSIESWLNKTLEGTANGGADPFTEPSIPGSALGVPESSVSRTPSYARDDPTEHGLTADHDEVPGGSKRTRRKRKSVDKDEKDEDVISPPGTPTNHRDTLPSQNSPPVSPGLRRTPAKRSASSPKTTRKLPFKDAVFDAFKGESAIRPRSASKEPSPFDFIGMREHDVRHTSTDYSSTQEDESVLSDPTPRKRSHRAQEIAKFEPPRQAPLPSFPKRMAPTFGGHRLSTIASVETFNTASKISSSSRSASETGSDLSHTTITQDTVLTGPTSSSLSRHSKKSSSKRSQNNGTLKRRLTKHADLVSMLSLPDTTQPGRAQSIRSARSIRTKRSNLETATIQDLLQELESDEAKYMRELNTLVDGVIPVLLQCVLSKNDSAIAAGLFDPNTSSVADSSASFSKPIVDMGIALERLKSLHRRIPISDAPAFLRWAQSAAKVYTDYLRAWRSGFQDVIVNLAPASREGSPLGNLDQNKMDLNKDGDVVRESGERVDVAYLLKRPLVRVKLLARLTTGLYNVLKTPASLNIRDTYRDLDQYRRDRFSQELARREDSAANNIDPTRARDARTMRPVTGVRIDRARQVAMKDTFNFDLVHTSGQRLECEVELILRENSKNDRDAGDLLVAESDQSKKPFLLFPPIYKDNLSARMGETDCELVVMVRGGEGQYKWSECFILEADEPDVAREWLDMLGTDPLPPQIVRQPLKLEPELASIIEAPDADTQSMVGGFKSVEDKTLREIPVGERRRREAEQSSSRRSLSPSFGPLTTAIEHLGEDNIARLSDLCIVDLNQLNDELVKAGEAPVTPIQSPTPARAKRNHTRKESNPHSLMYGALDPYPQEIIPDKEAQKVIQTLDAIYVAKKRKPSGQSIQTRPQTPEEASTPSREPLKPDVESPRKKPQPISTERDDGAPPPPAHRSPTTPKALQNIPILDTSTPRAKNRRTSSPLKHEYQPSETDTSLHSGTSSSSEEYDSEDSYTSSSESDGSLDDIDELDELDEEKPEDPAEIPVPLVCGKKTPPDGSIYSLENTSLAPSSSASQQVPFLEPVQERPVPSSKKFVAMIYNWDGYAGKWKEVYPEPCSIFIGPGYIQAFQLDSTHAIDRLREADPEALEQRLLLTQALTPHVPLRQSTAIDIEIRSPPADLTFTHSSTNFRYRCFNSKESTALYNSVHLSRFDNPHWKKLEEERRLNNFGSNAYDKAVAPSRRSWFLNRKKSYRISSSSRAPNYETSSQDASSTGSALKRFSGGGIFNIARSSILLGRGRPMSSNSSSEYSGATTPNSPSIGNSSSMYSNGMTMRNLGTENIKIRLYVQATSSNRWEEIGGARLTVLPPLPGQRQSSTLDNGPEKRIIVTRKPLTGSRHPEDPNLAPGPEDIVFFDHVIGAKCFTKVGRTGVLMTLWKDVRGDNGEVGVVGKNGGVAGTLRTWCFQCARAGDCEWVYLLCRSGINGGIVFGA